MNSINLWKLIAKIQVNIIRTSKSIDFVIRERPSFTNAEPMEKQKNISK